jgi:chromosome segregation ATPase
VIVDDTKVKDLQVKFEATNTQNKDLETKIKGLESHLKSSNDQNKRLEDDIKSAKSKIDELQRALGRKEKELEAIKNNTSLQTRVKDLQADLDKLKEKARQDQKLHKEELSK